MTTNKQINDESAMMGLPSKNKLYINMEMLPSIELRDTYFEDSKLMRNTMQAMNVPNGAKNKNTPADVATAFPPLNPAKTGKAWPIIASKPHSAGETFECSAIGSTQAMIPFNKSANATMVPPVLPNILKLLVAPRFPLPYPRISVL